MWMETVKLIMMNFYSWFAGVSYEKKHTKEMIWPVSNQPFEKLSEW